MRRAASAASRLAAAALCLAPAAASPGPAAPARQELAAARIDAANAASLLAGGVDATGGIGDWALRNGVLCAVVLDPSKEGTISARGGGLVDLGHCGADDDQFVSLEPLVNLARERPFPVEEMRAEVAGGEARLRARGTSGGAELTTWYVLDRVDPDRLRIVSRLERSAPGERVFALGDVVLHVDGSMRPFALLRPDRGDGPGGFRHPPIDYDSTLSVARALVPADAFVLVGADGLEPGIAYGFRVVEARLERASGESVPVPTFGLATQTVTTLAALARPPWIGGGAIGLLELAQTLFMDLGVGDALVVERELRVSRRADAASLTDAYHAGGAIVRGRVDDGDARLHVSTPEGVAVTWLRPGASGRFSLRLPAGDYVLRAFAPGGRSAERAFDVPDADGEVDLGELALGPGARVALPSGAPMRLVFAGEDGTPDPSFGDDLRFFRVGERAIPADLATRDVHLGATPRDPTSVVVAPGRYRVRATRGPEFTVTQTLVEARAGEPVACALEPPARALETPGWIAADLHVHAAPSDDTSVPLERRLLTFAAEGGEVLVATDHDHATDYGPSIEALGLGDRLRGVVGVEVTSSVRTPKAPHTFGHANVFPLPYRPLETRKGAPRSEGRRLRGAIAEVRALPGERIVQLNHPRSRDGGMREGAFFTHLAVAGEPFDPSRPLGAEPNRVLLEADPASGVRDIDFDAIELLNGPSMPRYRAVRADWFALLRQGVRLTGTANSDTHRLEQVAAVPRTYVRLDADRARAFDEAAFVRALRAGRAYGTTGPLLDVRLGGTGLGGLYTGKRGILRVSVRAAPWVPVSTARVFSTGTLVHQKSIEAPAALEIPLEFARDGFVTVEVEGEAGPDYAALLPGFTPFAFTNPIFVDADGDGRYTPPGLD